MTFALLLAAIRRHTLSVAFTLVLVTLTATLVCTSIPLVLATWVLVTLTSFELWSALEPVVLERLAGYREPTSAERQRLESALGRTRLHLLVADTTDLTAARGLRCLVVSRDLIEVFEDRALAGVLHQTATPVHAANLAGYAFVWIGNLPVLAAWLAIRLMGQMGRLLAVVLAMSLVLPLIMGRDVFLRCTGWLLTSVLVALIGSLLISAGEPAVGLGLGLAWLIVPGLQAVLAWESRRVEASADAATIADGFGPQLLEAVEFLVLAEPLPVTDKSLHLLCRPRSTSFERATRLRRALHSSHSMS